MNEACQLCGSDDLEYRFQIHSFELFSCRRCDLLFQFGPSQTKRAELASSAQSEIAEGGIQMNLVERCGSSDRAMLLVEKTKSSFPSFAEAHGFEVTPTQPALLKEFPDASFELCVLKDAIECVENINVLIQEVRRVLKDEGMLVVVTPSTDCWNSNNKWSEFRADRFFYFNAQNLECFLVKSGFHRILTYPDEESLPCMTSVCRKSELPAGKQRLSILVPVYNEKQTFTLMMEALLEKEVFGVEKEIIIVESNSTDGTREEVIKLQSNPMVRVVLEDRPRGKGHAVRAGLQQATGDIVIIQDADLEYDVRDYDSLLKPLLNYQRMFVLGSRHTGNWKMRQFGSQKLMSAYVNFGHILFTFLINRLHGSHLRDPFTMYKVFRKNCLFGLNLESNGFDLDWELVIKLLRKKYFPEEVPVNYKSRSFQEGKKIHLWKDPLRGLRALVRYRFCKFELIPQTTEAISPQQSDVREALASNN